MTIDEAIKHHKETAELRASWVIKNNGGSTHWYECSNCGEPGDVWNTECKCCNAKMINAHEVW